MQTPAPTPAADDVPERAARLLGVLAELTEIGMDLARELRREAVEAGGEAGPDVALRFSRVARAVRQSVALEARLAEELAAAAQAAKAEAQRQAAHDHAAQTRAGFERKLQGAYLFDRGLRDMRHDIDTGAVQVRPDELKAVREDMFDWLFDDVDDAAFATLPVGDVIVRICRDLGLAPEHAEWSDAAWEAAVRANYAHLSPAPEAGGDAPAATASLPGPTRRPSPGSTAFTDPRFAPRPNRSVRVETTPGAVPPF